MLLVCDEALLTGEGGLHMNDTKGLIVVGVLLALAITNPSLEKHKAAIGDAVVADLGFLGSVYNLLGLTDVAMDLIPFKYHNYIFFSTVTFGGSTASIGVLGQVITL